MGTSKSIAPRKAHARRSQRRETAPSKAELERMLLRTAFLRAEAARERSRD
jgi:hypothetical protein